MTAALGASAAENAAVAVNDSGWATSDAGASILDSPRVPIGDLLPADEINKIVVPTKPQPMPKSGKASAELKWRARSNDVMDAFATPRTTGPALMTKPAPSKAAPAKPAEDRTTIKIAPAREPALFPGLTTGPEKTTAPAETKTEPKIADKQDDGPTLDDLKDAFGSDTDDGPALVIKVPSEADSPKDQPSADSTAKADKPAAKPATEKSAPDKSAVKETPRVAARPTPKRPTRTAPAKPPAKPEEETTKAKPTEKKASPKASSKEAAKPQPAPPAAAPLKPLSRTQQYLRRRLRSVLAYYYRRPLNSREHDPWEVMHGMLAYGLHSRILDANNRNQPVTAIGYLCFNKPCKRKRLLHLSPDGEIDAEVAYGIQGHHGQFLAMLAQCDVSPKYPMRIEDEEFTIQDLIEFEKRTCYADAELSFKLIALGKYLSTDDSWQADDGEPWDFPKLIRIERNEKIRGAPCGGTHRLSGLALAVRARADEGKPIDGEFLEAKQFVEQYQTLALRMQNRDGSLSTEWFRGPGDEEDINRRVRTTGHILEWLLYSVPDEQLTDRQIVRAVNYLTNVLSSNTDNAWEIGPLNHALHALALYDQRFFEPHDTPTQVAKKGQRQPKPMTLSYHNIKSRVYGSYPSAEEAEEARERANAPKGLKALFGIGSSRSSRSR